MRIGFMRGFKSSALLCLAIVGLASSQSQAVLYISETFPYANGDLFNGTCSGSVGTNGTNCTPSGSCWQSHSGCATTGRIQVASNAIKVVQPGGEDDSLPLGFTASAGQKLYAAFDVNVGFVTSPAGQNVADSNSGTTEGGRYFAHFKDSGTSQFRARVYVTGFPLATATTGPNYTLGITTGSVTLASSSSTLDPSHPESKWGTGLNFGTTYRVVASWDYDTGNVEMWVSPALETDTKLFIAGDNTRLGHTDPCGATNDCPTPDGLTPINTFAYRQASGTAYGTGNTLTENIDNVCIASTFTEALNCTPGSGLGAFANVSPNPSSRGDTALFTSTVTGGSPFITANHHYNVTGDLSPLATSGGLNNQTFFDDGTHGDVTANDNIYSFALPISCSQALQSYSINLTVSDNANTVHPSTSLTVQDGGTPAILAGSPSDRVVCLHGSTFFSVNATGGGLTYQWFNGSNTALTNNSHFSGVTTRILTINDATATEAAAGPYYVKVTGACPTTILESAHAQLIIGAATASDKQVVINQVYSGAGCTNGTQCASNLCTNNACSSGTCNASSSNAGATCTVAGDCLPKTCTTAVDCGGNPTPCSLYDADFVELYNKGTTPVNLKGWSIQYAAASSGSVGTWAATPLSPSADFILKPGQYFLVKGSLGAPGTFQATIPSANATSTGTNLDMSQTVGEVALYKSSATVPLGSCPVSGDCLLVDLVGYGPGAGALGTCSEGSPDRAPSPDVAAGLQQSNAVVRLLCQDTDDNLADFAISTATPLNSSFTGSTGVGNTGTGGMSDLNLDGTTTSADLSLFTACLDGSPKHQYMYDPNNLPAGCNVFKGCDGKIQADLDRNGVLDMNDFALFQRCYQATPISGAWLLPVTLA